MPIATNDDLIASRTLDPVTIARFWGSVATGTAKECWDWTKSCNSGGYGVFSLQQNGLNVTIGAHRFAYISAFGPIADPAVRVTQTCRNRACINPKHLQATLAYGQGEPQKGKLEERGALFWIPIVAELAKAAIRKARAT